jgi:hypothetical protein
MHRYDSERPDDRGHLVSTEPTEDLAKVCVQAGNGRFRAPVGLSAGSRIGDIGAVTNTNPEWRPLQWVLTKCCS